MNTPAYVDSDATHVFPRELDRPMPLIQRASGVRMYDAAGNEYLDGVSGGAMVTSLGYGVAEIIDAAERQAREIPYIYSGASEPPRAV